MKIGLNATCFNGRPSGANQRFKGIYKELFKLMPNTEFVIYEPNDYNVSSWFKGYENIRIVKTPIPNEGRIQKLIKGFGYWNKVLNKENFDIFEAFHLPLVKPSNAKVLYTLHDVRRLNDGGKSSLDRALFKATLEKTMNKVNHIITVSHSMKDEILSFYPNSSISVIYNGIDVEKYKNISLKEQELFKKKYDLPSDFLLSVGHFEKRKNYSRLVEAIAYMHKQGYKCHLVIIGNDSGEKKTLLNKIKDLNLESYITLLSGLTDNEVCCAYKLSNLFIFPSSYEGFGIPILEAMAAETPIILSNIPVFKEITENKGVYFSYNNVSSIANTIESILFSKEKQNELVTYGKKRVKDFSFQSIAKSLSKLYNGI